MTNRCSGQTGTPLNGVNQTIVGTSAFIEALIASTEAWWVAPAVALLAVATYNLATFCDSTIPAMPTFTSAEANALLSLTPGADLTSALGKLPALIENLLWNANCQCPIGVTPTSVTPPSGPPGALYPGMRLMRPDIDNATLASICTGQNMQPDPAQHWIGFRSSPEVPMALLGLRVAGDVNPQRAIPIAIWKNHALVFQTTTPPIPFATEYDITIPPIDCVAGDQVSVAKLEPAPNTPYCAEAVTCYGPDFDPYWTKGTIYNTSGATLAEPTLTTWNADAEINVWFTTSPTALASIGCCPPNTNPPDLTAVLNAIAALGKPVQAYGSFISGPTTIGLTGSGTLAVTGSVAVRVDITSYGANVGLELGTPQALFGAGYITPVSPQGPAGADVIRYATQVFYLPPACQSIDYTFAAGITANITQLDAGP